MLFYTLITIFLSWPLNSVAGDPVPACTFYYGNVLLMKSDSDFPMKSVPEINLRTAKSRDLMIAFTYKGVTPSSGKLEIRFGGNTVASYLHEVPAASDAFAPTVSNGTHFVIPISDLVKDVSGDEPAQLSFFYSDDSHVTDLEIGSIRFVN